MPREYYNHFRSLHPLHTCPNIFSTQPMNHKRIIASPSFRVFLEKERLHFLWLSHKLHQIIFHFPDTALICVLLVWQRAAVYEWNQTSGGKQSRERHKYKTMIANNHQSSRMLYSSKALDQNPGGLWQNPCLGLQYQSGPSFIHRLQILTDRAQGRRNLCKYCCDYGMSDRDSHQK